MSGKDERPSLRLLCPECKCSGIHTKEWAIFVGFGSLSNWGRYYVDNRGLEMRYLIHCVGKKVYRIRCGGNPNEHFEGQRHSYYSCHFIFKNVMDVIGFKDGIVR